MLRSIEKEFKVLQPKSQLSNTVRQPDIDEISTPYAKTIESAFQSFTPDTEIICHRDNLVSCYFKKGIAYWNPNNSTTYCHNHSPAIHTAIQRTFSLHKNPIVHACCFSFEQMGVLVFGDSGTGKSTLTYAAMEAGAKIISDDLIVISNPCDSTNFTATAGRADLFFRTNTVNNMTEHFQQKLISGKNWKEARYRLARADHSDFFTTQTPITHILYLSNAKRSQTTKLNALDFSSSLSDMINACGFARTQKKEQQQHLLTLQSRLCQQIPAYSCNMSSHLIKNPSKTFKELCSMLQSYV